MTHDAPQTRRGQTPAFAGVALLFIFLLSTFSAFAADQKESAYDRVMRTGVLHCGYIVYPPETIKDPNTGKLSGTVIDTTEALGKQLGLKIDWTEEVPFANLFAGLKSGRIDALCAGLFESPARAREALFTIPSNYGVTYVFTRVGDTRFDNGFSSIDDPKIKIATIDGELGQSIATEQFPRASQTALPQMSDVSMVLETVATKKADVAFLQKGPAKGFLKNNPGKVRIAGKEPLRAFPAPLIAVRPDETSLKFLLDAGIRTLLLNGTVEKILRRYDPELDSYLLVAKPYEVSK